MQEKIVKLICDRLRGQLNFLREQFSNSNLEVGVRYAVVDDLLPEVLARDISDAFPVANSMRLMNSFREKEYTSKSFDKFDPLMSSTTFAVQDPRVINLVGEITGIREQVPDAHLYAGGLSAMRAGHFLAPHIDNSHDSFRKDYSTLNLLYYATPDWSLECGGNLELWNRSVKRNTTIVSKFNRLVVMETNPWSWHSVSPVKVERIRCCVSNYYFALTFPTGEYYFNVTSISARLEKKGRRVLAWVDNKLGQALRQLAPAGLGKKDICQGPVK